jgi:hypothetical protein
VDFTEYEDGEESYHYPEDDDDASHDDIDPNEIANILNEEPIQAQLTESNRNDTQEEIYQPEEEYDTNDSEHAEGSPDNNQTDEENDNNQSEEENENEEDEIPAPPPQQMRRSARTAKPTAKYLTYVGGNYSQIADRTQETEYTEDEAKILATIMDEFNERINISKEEYGNQFAVTYSLNKGMKQFGEAGRNSVLKEMKQLHASLY